MYKRGDVYYADLSPVVGSEQGGTRPVLIVQNDMGNYFAPTVIVAPITAKVSKAKLPTHVPISAKETGIGRDSMILLEQIRTLDKSRLKDKVCELEPEKMEKVNQSLLVSLDLDVKK